MSLGPTKSWVLEKVATNCGKEAYIFGHVVSLGLEKDTFAEVFGNRSRGSRTNDNMDKRSDATPKV